MLFRPNGRAEAGVAGDPRGSLGRRIARRMVSTLVALIIICGLGYIVWSTFRQPPAFNARPDLPVPVLAATPQRKDVPVYLDGVGAVRALNMVTVRAQVDGK